ncbi:MAG: type II toxin-antitoxin system RelE/ParE family toxin [Hyphomicrobiaceae bacterium]
MIVEWTEEALADLDEVLGHYQSHSPEVARRMPERVLGSEAVIQTFPKSGKYDQETDTYDAYVPHTRLILTYRITDEITQIIRVWHTSRDPETKPER